MFMYYIFICVYCPCSAAKSCPTLCDPMDCTTPGFPVLHHLLYICIYIPLYFILYTNTFIFPWWLRRLRICLQCRRSDFDPWVKKVTWRRAWQPTPVFLPGESHGQRSLVGSGHGVAKSQMQLSNEYIFIYNTCFWHMYKNIHT